MMATFERHAKKAQLYVITTGASDIPPGKFCVREHLVPGGATKTCALADSLEEARTLVPAWADQNLGRMDGDDPVIVESWV